MPPDGAISAVVLAAGASRRFGNDNKLLAHLDGRSLIEHVIDALAAGGVANVVVVTGCDREAVARLLTGREVRLVHNAGWEAGMGGSIGVGIAALGPAASGALIVPGDMPLLTAGIVAALCTAFEAAGRDRVVYPALVSGGQRNPVLWPRRFFADLEALPPGAGAKALLMQVPEAQHLAVHIEDEAVLADVDTPAELEAVRGRAISPPKDA